MDALLQSLFVWAVTLTAYSDPGYLPKLSAVTQETLSSTLCGGNYCTAVAYYDTDTETIFYDKRMALASDHAARGFVLHEMVHFLQHKNGVMETTDTSCERRIELEREAYRVQQFFLEAHKMDTLQVDLAVAVLPSLCAEQQE